jgi:cellulose synthase/poly-beta-1,6-N-acetylglucosamine synthase-like glycosyltransferase
MTIFLAFTGLLLFLYALLILYYHWIWNQIPSGGNGAALPAPDAREGGSPQAAAPVSVSVIIPARNEEGRIGNCLQSLFAQSYPAELTEIIVVNDFSTDRTAAVVEPFAGRVRLLNLFDFTAGHPLNAYKKKAIEVAIAHSSGELILCTDADCVAAGPEWISTLVRHYRTGDHCILAAPVKIETGGSLLSVFQALDFISLQGITGAAVYKNLYPMCNGANLAYSRAAFHAVDGFRDIDHIASGDDMLLMRKMQSRFPGKAAFVKDPEAMVRTGAAENLHSFFRQRIRWASKISHYGHPATLLTLGLVYLLNACLLLLFLLSFRFHTWAWLVCFLLLKTFAEFFFVSRVAGFFRQQPLMKYFIFCQPFHILYTVIAGALGLFGQYKWKGRRVR